MNKGNCKICGCNNNELLFGLCAKHYIEAVKKDNRNIDRSGTIIQIDDTIDKKYCSVKGCRNLHYTNGYCRHHLDELKVFGKIKEKQCKIHNCNNVHYSNELCRLHYDKLRIIKMKGKMNNEKI